MKQIAILGAGKSGLSAYRHYKNLNKDVVLWDENPQTVAALAQEYNFVDYHNWDYANLDFIIVSPGIALEHPVKHFVLERATAVGVKIYVDVELFIAENPDVKYIAITGTKGKSTTTALIQHIFEAAGKKCIAAGNIGTPVFDVDAAAYEYIVLELSSFQLDKMHHIHFNCAVLTNISEDHIAHHGNFENYRAAKLKIFANQNFNDVAVVGADFLDEIKDALNSKIIPISRGDSMGASIVVGTDFMLDKYFTDNKNLLAYEDLIYLRGEHNHLNVATAYAVAKFFGLDEEKILSGIIGFKGLAHRQNYVATINNIVFINDSKSTTQISTMQALKSFKNIYLILGGDKKTQSLNELLPLLKQVLGIFLIGESTPLFAGILQENNISFMECGDLKTAIMSAFKAASQKGSGTILLSPATASFDQFKNAEDRGNTFVRLVEELKS
ncbi:MAG: UDP-N-acetylmuramoyl-L-alanine--D-glutamate ligase [Alphaproteobacteria bacterium]|jgi:UDP-N-acetylmuramoylalanine--D-glutamate ligase|nr:UDP-N-acetylmuramoyl-L-alanine--D-glutamate ligase [Alphaproteobacteria bacterium]